MTNNTFPSVPQQPILYDWLYQDTDKDVDMYARLTQGHSQILECGVGTGRLTIPWAEQGKTVVGIDSSAEMLGRFREKLASMPQEISDRIHLHQADMCDFDLQQEFSFVTIPFGSFHYLLTTKDQKACLSALRRHLSENGTLVIDLATWEEAMDEKWLANDAVLRKDKQVVDPRTGKTVEMWSTFRFDSKTQIMEQDRHYRIYGKGGVLESEQAVLWQSRFFFLGEFQLLAELCGLEITEVYGDYHLGPHAHDSQNAVVVMKKASLR